LKPPLSAYCRWREAEALVAAGASRAEAAVPLREAYGVATRIGSHILRKLDVSNRLEAAAFAHRIEATQSDREPEL